MHGYDSRDLARSFRTVRENTVRIAEDIPADKYGFRPADGTRTVGETLAHIAVSSRWPQRAHGDRSTQFTIETFQATHAQQLKEEAALKTKAQILDALRKGGEEFAAWMEKVPGDVLAEKVNFPVEAQLPPKTRFEMLLSTKEHEMHHRGGLMVVERMLGIVPHLTRRMEERMAAMSQPQSQQASASGRRAGS